ncbi:MAG: methionyl-tRNA formyltransferase [Endomicrobium sp.]|jgi:methionyl-tRNA formyltransferase|nr:methionyl-tRNA formyltransferase [Endomicrobium sp.]
MVKILFFGTAAISKAFLENLYENKREILCVTMPDKPASRGQKLTPPAVKTFAVEKGLPYIQPEKFTQDIIERIKSFDADVGIAVAYGKIIPQDVFNLAKHKTFNIHFSLLPKYRGAAPVQHALLNGETQTGVSSFYLEKTLDTGNILLQTKIPIDEKDNAQTLFEKLIPLGIKVMNDTLELLKNANTEGSAQEGPASYAPSLKKEDGLINWRKSSEEILNALRGFYPWPGIYCVVSKGKLQGKRIKILDFEIVETASENADAGKVLSVEKNKGFSVVCGKGKILVVKVQPENKHEMPSWDFLQSGQLKEGDELNGKV